jgi:hypothetical protein
MTSVNMQAYCESEQTVMHEDINLIADRLSAHMCCHWHRNQSNVILTVLGQGKKGSITAVRVGA